jgi:hypothetical protein
VLSDGVADVVALSVPDALCKRKGLDVALFDVVAEAVAEIDGLPVPVSDGLAERKGGGAESAASSEDVSTRV